MITSVTAPPLCSPRSTPLNGKVIATCMPQHRHQEWLKFLRLIDKSTPKRKQLHLIIDNYSPHKHPDVQAWLKKHQRFQIHFTPTSASWLNMVERFFRDLTQKQIRRGCFGNVAGTNRDHRTIRRSIQLQPKAFCLDRKSFRHSGKGQTRSNGFS